MKYAVSALLVSPSTTKTKHIFKQPLQMPLIHDTLTIILILTIYILFYLRLDSKELMCGKHLS